MVGRSGRPWPRQGSRRWTHPHLVEFLRETGLGRDDVAVGWGYRPSGRRAQADAGAGGGKLLLLEDALVRSIRPGTGTSYGLVADSVGIYYDAIGHSDLIQALETGEATGWMRRGQLRADEIESTMARFRALRVSKYNWYPGDFAERGMPEEPGVMVVDQTRGDTSLDHGGMRMEDFGRMVRDALDEHPAKPILLRSHPDHLHRGKFSCFPEWVFNEPRIRVLPQGLSPARCFDFCEEVYAGTSLMGMEALLHGRRVKAYGWNFYAGWGLTEDRCESPVRPRPVALDLARLFEAAYLQYGHYFDPDSGESCELDRILDHLELQQRVAEETAGRQITVGWSAARRSAVGAFFKSPGTELIHCDSAAEALELAAVPAARVLVWGEEIPPLEETARVARVEAGPVLRSPGHLLSVILEDPEKPFDRPEYRRLNAILDTVSFDDARLADARELLGLLGAPRASMVPPGQDARVIAIPAEPGFFDGTAGFRRHVSLSEPGTLLVSRETDDGDHADASNLLDRCDSVHVFESIFGFEALVRGVPVTTHGTPFYAGRGLTHDHAEFPISRRRLTLEELVCGVLICYPRYLNPLTGEFTGAVQIARMIHEGVLTRGNPSWPARALLGFRQRWGRRKSR